MSKLSKKIFLSVSSLILACTSFASVTFAWMSLNSEAWVDGMQFQATGGEGFLISVDNNIYKASLTKADIHKAIVKKYRPKLTFDQYGNLFDPDNEIIINNYDTILEENIMLLPCTSYGSSSLILTNLSGSALGASDGKFIEFDIYFKSASDISSNLDIYLNGKDTLLNIDGQQYKVPQTKVQSANTDVITLTSSLVTFIKGDSDLEHLGDALEMRAGETLKVNSSNALRLGFINEQDNVARIVEFADELDLGSYATNINEYTNTDDSKYDDSIEYDPRYDATKNAMFTFYNELKNTSLTAIDYKSIPQTITSLLDSNGENHIKLCTLTPNGNEVKVSFKLWLEGWDADSIEGIAESIVVQLSFSQEK